MAEVWSRDLPARREGRGTAREPRGGWDEWIAARAIHWRDGARQQLLIQLRAWHRAVSLLRRHDHSQPARLQRSRLQPSLLYARPGFGGPSVVRAELAQF